MADSPKYQKQSIQYEGAQPYDLANLRESIRLSKSTEAGLNRISEFAFKSQAERAKKAGLEYGVANPPTIVQISEQEIRGNLDAIIQGHSKVLAQLNPEESLRYRQSVTVLGHAVYKTALDRIENLVKAENIVKVDESINTLKSNIPSLLDTYPTIEEFKAALSVEKNIINEKMMNIDPNKIPEYTKEIDKVIKTAVIDHVGKYILNDLTFANTPGEAAMKILDGQAGDKTQLLNEYLTTPEDRMEVVKKLTEKKVAQINLFESVEKTNKKLKEDEYRLIMRDYAEGRVGPQETINALKAKGIPISNDEFKAIMEAQDANEGNLKTFSNMMNRVNTDTLSIGEIDTAAKNKRITFKQALDLKEKYFTRTDNDREVKNSVMNVIGTTSEELMTKPEKALFVAKGIEASTKEIKELRAKGIPFNIDDIAKKNTLVVMDTVYTQDYKDAQAELRRLSSKYKFTYSEDAYSPKQVDKMFKDIPKEDRRLIKQSLYEIQNYNNKQRSKASQ